MLKRIGESNLEGARTTIAKAAYPMPFKEGLEYSSPARGTWNIVHTGMLIPESHQIFVCAMGCLRGVVLTAAEANVMDRYSSIMIREENVLDGTMETLMIEGVADIIEKLKKRPKAILLFISCQHFFLAYDQNQVFRELRNRFPDIRFMDCYMIPTLRKSGLTPDQKMRIQMYSLWERMPKKINKINHIGSNIKLSRTCEIFRMLQENGIQMMDLYECQSFEDYQKMAESCLNIFYEPLVLPSARELKKRLDQDYLYLTFSFDEKEIEENYQKLADVLSISRPDFSKEREAARAAIQKAKELIGDTPLVLDYSFTFRTFSFCRFLLENGFHVTQIYGDGFLMEDEGNFRWIQENYPEIEILSCNRPKMRFVHAESQEKVLAIGQKAAYFSGTDFFVNVAESGGFFGYDGICQIAELMEDAFLHEKDRRLVIQKKGYSCESCVIDD